MKMLILIVFLVLIPSVAFAYDPATEQWIYNLSHQNEYNQQSIQRRAITENIQARTRQIEIQNQQHYFGNGDNDSVPAPTVEVQLDPAQLAAIDRLLEALK